MRHLYTIFFLSFFVFTGYGQDGHNHDHNHAGHDHSHHNHAHDGSHHGGDHNVGACQIPVKDPKEFNAGEVAFHHIADQNVFSIGPLQLPLPVIAYVHGEGLNIFSSGKLHADYHGVGEAAYDRFVLYNGSIRRITDASFPMGLVELGHHRVYSREVERVFGEKTKTVDQIYVCYNGQEYDADSKSTLDGGMLGGGITSFTDFSITKNVMTMFIIFITLSWLFLGVAKKYKERRGMAPKGSQNLVETMFVFIQDEVAKPFLGHKWEKYTPFLMALFFFILALNLFGQIPFLGNANVTGNLSFTFALALFTFLVTNISGNSHYWGHVFNMPGVPLPLKIFIITPVEILGLFIKPITLMLRLFGNITAGHMVIVIFVGLIFVFGQNGHAPGAALGTTIASGALTLFMMAIELIVAFIQAFVFTILTASYLGAATEEAHH